MVRIELGLWEILYGIGIQCETIDGIKEESDTLG
jgi:hypothetical protein